ncbi:aBC-type transport system [Clostridium bornimense]|uniref:ABC-type transport system n=1 Tax=Clostridium bornimense TaxID=1216932 RepID=W6RX37_9CLOT|nr:FtsX-like permease family protein [Clostridium bornimense]CDM68199.1 aBC-type transport system [Clostridium bornimense]
MNNSLVKLFIRQIKNTKSRFISIMVIVALGVGFFVGVKGASPSMKYSADKFFKENNLMDYKVMSSYGFREEDVTALKNMKGIQAVMPSYSTELLVKSNETEVAVKVHAIPKAYDNNDKNIINKVNITEGRLPKKSGECVLGKDEYTSKTYKIGDKIKFVHPDEGENIEDILEVQDYTVVGFVDSPQYISYDKGVSTIGNGSIAFYMMILPEDFNYKRYTEVYLKTDVSDKYESFFDESYKKDIEKYKDDIEVVGNKALKDNYNDIIKEANKQLDDAVEKLQKEKDKAEKEIKDAEDKLIQGREEIYKKEALLAEGDKKLKDSFAKLESSKLEISQGEQLLSNAIENYNRQIEDGKNQIDEGRKQYTEKLNEYDTQYDQFKVMKSKAEKEIDESKKQLEKEKLLIDALQNLYDRSIENKDITCDTIDDISNKIKYKYNLTEEQKKILDNITSEIKSSIMNNEILEKAIEPLSNKITDLTNQYNEGVSKVTEAEKQLQDAENKFLAMKTVLDDVNGKLIVAEEELNNNKVYGENEIENSRKKISNGKNQIALGEKEYANGKSELEKGRAQLVEAKNKIRENEGKLEQSKNEAEKKFALADDEIEQKKKEVKNIEIGKWYILTNEDNTGFTSFAQDADRIDGIASIFPLFFFIVAALVCLTNMTRMVEEERTEIGTLQALGYENKSIIAKYFFYALLAAMVGSIIGIIVGLSTLPRTIFSAYDAMYKLPQFYVKLNFLIILIAILGALLSTCTVAYVVASKELKLNSATLMRPKAPKKGKRILLERIPIIWNRINFSAKVTIRNILRYKARFIMTVLGVAGCTALILAAYGLKDSISGIISKQYGEIFSYDAMVKLKSDGTLKEKESLLDNLDLDKRFKSNMLINQTIMDSNSDKVKNNVQVRLFIPESTTLLSDYVGLKDFDSGKNIDFNNKSVVITEKLAKLLDIKVGDVISIKDDNIKIDLNVTNIAENYIYNYVYISPDIYENKVHEEVKFNSVLLKFKNDKDIKEGSIAEDWLKKNDVLVITFTSYIIDSFQDMISSLNFVVVIMIVCAAALAFVVLYNLTNINISERLREIATIKVLGFTDGESANYVYRENMILSIIGIVVGLFIGVFLSRYIVGTIEMDIVMFERKVDAISFVYATAFTLVFSILVNIFMYKKINNISMVESLKSIE